MLKNLDAMSTGELKATAKALLITGYSKLTKPELIALIAQFIKAARRTRAKAPLGTVDRIANYVKANGSAKLTARQERQVARAGRRNKGIQKSDIPSV